MKKGTPGVVAGLRAARERQYAEREAARQGLGTEVARVSEPLPPAEGARLAELEARIRAGLETFVSVGEALAEIRDARLYRATHGSYDAYIADRWGFTGRRARQLEDASRVARRLEAGGGPVPRTARQAAAVGKLPEAEQPAAMQAAVAAAEADGAAVPAQRHVEAAVAAVEARIPGGVTRASELVAAESRPADETPTPAATTDPEPAAAPAVEAVAPTPPPTEVGPWERYFAQLTAVPLPQGDAPGPIPHPYRALVIQHFAAIRTAIWFERK